MHEALYLGKYPPPAYPVPARARCVMGLRSFPLLPPDLRHAPVCVDSVFADLTPMDAAAVRRDRARLHSWVDDERGLNAPFLSMLRERKS